MVKKYEAERRNEYTNLEQILRFRLAVDEFRAHKKLVLEQRRNFKDQIAVLSGKSGDIVQRKYYNYLSENLSHDLLYVINCLKDLLYRPEFQEFEEVKLWSDSGPHFKNADYLYSVCLELARIFSLNKFKLN
ncbi:hypothetical protein BB560_004023 [Smittium megazygosporum]|uniref:Uncharacterized protein n=1 Tax=Smittium megazygosporum TaxID=133381 RepID=A0A2T9ZAG7_9FUNG|nr:hypothetical protein BB560_004023 [Smittium megazygosporum]